MVSLSPPGTHAMLPNVATAGPHNIDQASRNLVDVRQREKRALDNGFFVEVIALRSQATELFLRMYVAAKRRAPFPVGDKSTLGTLIDEAGRHGLAPVLVARRRSFNAGRIV